MNWGDLAAGVGALAAVAAAAIAWWQAMRSRRSARESAEYSRRAVDAAERSAAADERQVVLAEAAVAARRKKPPWQFERVSSTRYLMFNKGGEAAYDVSVEGGCLLSSAKEPHWDRVGRGESVDFYAQPYLGGSDGTVTVSWAREPGGERSGLRHTLA